MADPAKNRLIVTQDVLESEVASLVDSAPETLDTLSELAEALGNDPNFATTVSTEIGLRAKTSDVNIALNAKADKTDPRFTDARPPTAHTHTPASLGAEPAQWYGTQAQYDALATKDPNRTYNILEG